MALGGSGANRKGWYDCHCPIYDDEHPSLGIKDLGSGRIALNCFVCRKEGASAIYDYLRKNGLYTRPKGRASREEQDAIENEINQRINEFWQQHEWVHPVNERPSFYVGSYPTMEPWTYRDALGGVNFYEARYERDGKKFYLPHVYSRERATGKYRWAWAHVLPPRPLYGLDRLAARPNAKVIVCEGCKSTDAAEKIFPDCVAVSNILDAAEGAAEATDWTPLRGRIVIPWPDKDIRGKKHVEAAAKEVGAASVRIVQLPSDVFDKGWDLADPVPEGVDLRALLDEAEEYDAKTNDGTDDGFIRGEDKEILKSHPLNVGLALKKLGMLLRYNAFASVIEITGLSEFGPEVTDPAAIRLRFLIGEQFHFLPTKTIFDDVLIDEAYKNKYHPVCDYLDALKWDRVPRIDTWMRDYAEAEDTELNRAIGRIYLVAAVRRVRQPGVKFDTMPIFESPQGKNKSKALCILATRDDWFSDCMTLDLEPKEAIEQSRGVR